MNQFPTSLELANKSDMYYRELIPLEKPRRRTSLRRSCLILLLLIIALCLTGCLRTGKQAQSRNSRSNYSHEGLVDLNSASKAELIRLPGIGEAYAQRIMDHRPYREKTDLTRRNIIPENTYRQIADRIIARQN